MSRKRTQEELERALDDRAPFEELWYIQQRKAFDTFHVHVEQHALNVCVWFNPGMGNPVACVKNELPDCGSWAPQFAEALSAKWLADGDPYFAQAAREIRSMLTHVMTMERVR